MTMVAMAMYAVRGGGGETQHSKGAAKIEKARKDHPRIYPQ